MEQPTAEWLHQPDPDESRTGCASYLDEKWLTIPGRERRLLEPMLAPGVPLGTLVEICVGVQTSADKIFLFEEWREAGSGLVEVRSRALKRRVKLEANMLRTCIKGSRDKSDAGQPILLLWPYGKDETLMTPEQLGQTAGHVWSYLKACETKLRSREKGRFNDDQWYRFGRDQGIRQCGMPKVILPAILRTGTATVDEGGELTYTASGEGGGGAWGLLPRNRELDMQALAEFLRSDVVWRYFKALGFPQRGGWRGVDKSVLDPLPVPRELVPTDL